MEPFQPLSSRPVYSYALQDNQSCEKFATEGNVVAAAVDTQKDNCLQSRTITLEEFPQGRKNSVTFTARGGNLPFQLSQERCFFVLGLLRRVGSQAEMEKFVLGVLTFDTSTFVQLPNYADLSVNKTTGMTIDRSVAGARVNFWDLAVMKSTYQADCPVENSFLTSRCFMLPDEPHLAVTSNAPNLFHLWDSRKPNNPVRQHRPRNRNVVIEYPALLKTGWGTRLVMKTCDSNILDFMDLTTVFGQKTHQLNVSHAESSSVKERVSIVAAQDGILTTRTEHELATGAKKATLRSYDYKEGIPESPRPFITYCLDAKPGDLSPGREVVCNNETFGFAYNHAIQIYRRTPKP